MIYPEPVEGSNNRMVRQTFPETVSKYQFLACYTSIIYESCRYHAGLQ